MKLQMQQAAPTEEYCHVHSLDITPCKHIGKCINCVMEDRPKDSRETFCILGEEDFPIYMGECFYCVLQGKSELCDEDTPTIREVMEGFAIGFRDGKYGKRKVDSKIDRKKCKLYQLVMLYNDGYNAGQNAREVCALAQEVLPKQAVCDKVLSEKNRDPAAKALRKLLRSKDVPSGQFTYDTETYPKCVVVLGETKEYKDVLKELGGKWNASLKCGKGWMFPKGKLA
jgi:hypothetical protein